MVDVPSEPRALAACVGDVDTFRRETLGQRPYRGNSPTRLAPLFDLDGADRALTGHGLRQPSIRLIADGTPVPPAEWTTTARTGAHRISDLIDGPRALNALANGTTVVFQSLQRWWPELTRFCRELEGDFGHVVQANAYLTPPGAAGLAPHHDTHDVLIIQTHGSKSWAIREPLVEAPLTRHSSDHAAAAETPIVDKFDLTVGDCLYLPRGWIHSAAAQTEMSLHITIGILERTAVDVLGEALDRAADDLVELRRSISIAAPDNDQAEQRLRVALDTMRAHLSELEPADLIAHERQRFAELRRPAQRGQLIDLAKVGNIDDDTRLRVADPGAWTLDADDDRAVLRRHRQTIELPAALEPTLRWLLDADAFTIADLVTLDHDGRAVLARRLVRDGVLTIEA